MDDKMATATFDEETCEVFEKTDEGFLQAMTKFPALYDKSKKDHSDRNVTLNGWKTLSKLMEMPVEDVKEWWAKLLREYRSEKNKRETETRSGSGAAIKREYFPFYETMKDMLKITHASGPKNSNYRPFTANQTIQQQQLSEKDSEGYNFKIASGRSGKKAFALKDTVDDLNEAIQLGYSILKSTDQSLTPNDLKNPNAIIGSIVQRELEEMGVEKSSRKRQELNKLLTDHQVIVDSSEE